MSDEELIELAAKAYGINPKMNKIGGEWQWNPLESDADAFRLMVDLGIDIERNIDSVISSHRVCVSELWFDDFGGDKRLATRTAITRCAAEIQRRREAE